MGNYKAEQNRLIAEQGRILADQKQILAALPARIHETVMWSNGLRYADTFYRFDEKRDIRSELLSAGGEEAIESLAWAGRPSLGSVANKALNLIFRIRYKSELLILSRSAGLCRITASRMRGPIVQTASRVPVSP